MIRWYCSCCKHLPASLGKCIQEMARIAIQGKPSVLGRGMKLRHNFMLKYLPRSCLSTITIQRLYNRYLYSGTDSPTERCTRKASARTVDRMIL